MLKMPLAQAAFSFLSCTLFCGINFVRLFDVYELCRLPKRADSCALTVSTKEVFVFIA
jgi:hypothetical protein